MCSEAQLSHAVHLPSCDIFTRCFVVVSLLLVLIFLEHEITLKRFPRALHDKYVISYVNNIYLLLFKSFLLDTTFVSLFCLNFASLYLRRKLNYLLKAGLFLSADDIKSSDLSALEISVVGCVGRVEIVVVVWI